MRLAECLNQTDMEHLRRIAEHHACECPLYSKNALLQEILTRFSEPAYVRARLESVSRLMEAAIEEIALDGRDSFAREDLIAVLARAGNAAPVSSTHAIEAPTKIKPKNRSPRTRQNSRGLSTDEPKAGDRPMESLLRELLSEGVLIETGAASRRTYICPTDVWKHIRAVATKRLRESVQSTSQTPALYRDDGTAMARDAVALLLFAERHDVRLTQDGVIFRRQQSQLLELMEIREEPLALHVGWRFGYGRRFRDYPDRLSLLYDYLFDRHILLESVHGRLLSQKDEAHAFSSLSEEERQRELFRFWLRTYRSAIPGLRNVVARLTELTARNWIYGDSLRTAILDLVNDYYYETKEEVYERRIIQMLVSLGLLREGRLESGAAVYHSSSLGARLMVKPQAALDVEPSDDAQPAMALAVVEPTFDVLVPPEGEAVYGWDLQFVADLLTSDLMRHYRITRDSVYRALQNGWDRDRIFEFFERVAAHGLPDSVARTVAGWCEEYGRVRVDLWCVVTCADPATAEEIRRFAPLSNRVVPVILGEQSVAFTPEDLEPVVSMLKKLGYLVKTSAESKSS